MLHAAVLAALLTQADLKKNPLIIAAQAAAGQCATSASKVADDQVTVAVINDCSASAKALEALFPLKGSVDEKYIDLWYYDAALSHVYVGVAYWGSNAQAASAELEAAMIECEFIIHDPHGSLQFSVYAGKMEDHRS